MTEQCTTTKKETTKFENLTGEMDRMPGLISTIFQTISNIEERLGEIRDVDDLKCEERPDPSSIIEKNTIKVRDTNNDLISIQDRLRNISELF